MAGGKKETKFHIQKMQTARFSGLVFKKWISFQKVKIDYLARNRYDFYIKNGFEHKK